MKKLHDQLLRNIHTILEKDEPDEVSRLEIREQLLRSSALPAHQYINGFKNFQQVLEVACNGNNNKIQDIDKLIHAAQAFWYECSYKRHKVPFTFYIEILSRLNNLTEALHHENHYKVNYLLEDAVEHLEKNYDWNAIRDLLNEYEKAHPEMHEYIYAVPFTEEPMTPELQKVMDEYHALHKRLRFGATYKWRAFFEQVLKQFKVIMGDKL